MIQRILFFLLIMCASAISVHADNPFLKRPLSFVPADSVLTWDYAGNDFRTLAMRADTTLRPRSFVVTREVWKERQRAQQFTHELLRHLNVVGGGDDEVRDTQGLPAMMNIASSAYMFLLTGRAVYVDAMERSLYNAALRTARNDSLPAQSADRRNALIAVMSTPGWIYAVDGNNLYVNLFTNSTARISLPECSFTFDQITDMPASGVVKFRVSRLRGEHRFAVRLRIPDWLVGRNDPLLPYSFAQAGQKLPTIYVSGHEWSSLEVDDDGYLVIDRTWHSLDEIYMELPLTPQPLRRTNASTGQTERGQIAWQSGPLVYAVTQPHSRCYFSANNAPQTGNGLTRGGLPLMEGTMYSLDGAKADAAAPEVSFTAVPYCETAADSLGVWCRECK